MVMAIVVWGAPGPAAAQTATVALQRIDLTGLPDIAVYFTVTGPDGRAILGLTPGELRVDLDGTTQPVSSLRSALEGGEHLALAVLFDRSGSMTSGLSPAREAALEFISRLSQGDRVAIISFDDTVAVERELTSDHDAVVQAINGIDGGRDTALFDALLEGLAAVGADNTRRRAVIVLSDGKDTRSQSTLPDVVDRARSLGVAIYAVGLPVDVDRETLDRLVSETGGSYLQAASSDELRRLYQLIAEQLQNQYLASFSSTYGIDEAWHRLTLTYDVGSAPPVAASREFVVSTGPGITRSRRQGLERDLVRTGLLTAAGIGAAFGGLAGVLLLLLAKVVRPMTFLVSLRSLGVLVLSGALGATLAVLVPLLGGGG